MSETERKIEKVFNVRESIWMRKKEGKACERIGKKETDKIEKREKKHRVETNVNESLTTRVITRNRQRRAKIGNTDCIYLDD